MKRMFLKNTGFKYTLNRKSLILQLISMTKENQNLTNVQIESFIKATSTYFDQISNKKNLQELFGNFDIVSNDNMEYEGTFYKFIHEKTYDSFISKGKFQLGSLGYYREIENDNSRDEKEGFSNLILNSGNRQILTSVISGFDKYIFCGTYNLDQKASMAKSFGGYVLMIKSLGSFAKKVSKAIGAESYLVRKVSYTDYKAYSTEFQLSDLNGVSPDLSDELFEILLRISEYPSVFSKPVRFTDEQELRLAFTMPKNVKRTLNFDNLGLLDDVELFKL